MQAASGQPLVSGQLTHMPSAQVHGSSSYVSGGPFTINHIGASTADLLAHLPTGVRPQGPASRESAPKTVAEFADTLAFWLENTQSIRTPPELFDAWHRYVRLAVQYANDVGVACSRAYHGHCMEAAQKGWWHPLSNGARCTDAYISHIAPASAARGNRWSRSADKTGKPAAGGFKRKAQAPAQSTPATRSRPSVCSLHPDSNHTDAQCYQQHGDVRQPDRNRPAAGGSGRRAPAQKDQ